MRVERDCPWCAERILAAAIVCKHCGRDVGSTTGGSLSDLPTTSPTSHPTAATSSNADAIAMTPAESTSAPAATSVSSVVDTPPPAETPDVVAALPAPDEPSAPDAAAATLTVAPSADAPAPTPSLTTDDASSDAVRDALRAAPSGPDAGRARVGPRPPSEAALKGVGGWLAWFAFGQIVTMGTAAYNVFTYLSDVAQYRHVLTALGPGLAGAEQFLAAMTALIGIGAAVALVLIIKEHPNTPTYCTAFMLACVLISIPMAGVEFRILDFQKTAGTTKPADAPAAFRVMFYCFAWMLYWMRSKRVASTFGYTGMRPPLSTRRSAFGNLWNRTTGGTAAVAFAVMAVIAIVGSLQGAPAPAAATPQSTALPVQQAGAATPEDAMAAGGERLFSLYLEYLPLLDSLIPGGTPAEKIKSLSAYQDNGSRGLHEMSDSALTVYAGALGTVYSQLREAQCAEFAAGGASDSARSAFFEALQLADAPTQRAFVSTWFAAIAMDLRGYPRRRDRERTVIDALRALQHGLSATDSARLEPVVLGESKDMSVADRCFALRTLYREMPQQLPPAQVAAVIRGARSYPPR